MIEERWLPISGWETHYEISDLGRIRTVPRRVPCKGGKTRQIRARIRRPSPTNCGYLTITLSRGQEVRHASVHPLVLEAFVGPRPPGMECCHTDGDKTNNALSNLRWDTKKANELDAIRIGKRPDPNRTHCRVGHELTEDNLYFIKAKPALKQCRKCFIVYNARRRAKTKLKQGNRNLSQAELSALLGRGALGAADVQIDSSGGHAA
jgi:hypothetical protein